MRDILMMRGARVLVEDLGNVQAGENVLIVADAEKVSIARVVAAACHARGAETVISIMAPRSHDGQEPPPVVAAAMRKADIIFTPVSISVSHTDALREALAGGARALSLSAYTEDVLIGGGLQADFKKRGAVCGRLVELITATNDVHVTTPAGTDVRFSIRGRPGIAMNCLARPGSFSGPPNIAANCAPVEGTAEGLIVVDASLPYIGIGVIREPIRIKVEQGMMTSIDGGEQARMLRDAYESTGDPNVYNLAQFGIGLNDKGRICGVMQEDQGAYGTAHFGTGTNILLGGRTRAACHYDLIIWKPTVTYDAKAVMSDGHLRQDIEFPDAPEL